MTAGPSAHALPDAVQLQNSTQGKGLDQLALDARGLNLHCCMAPHGDCVNIIGTSTANVYKVATRAETQSNIVVCPLMHPK
jgi:hypothetical protein